MASGSGVEIYSDLSVWRSLRWFFGLPVEPTHGRIGAVKRAEVSFLWHLMQASRAGEHHELHFIYSFFSRLHEILQSLGLAPQEIERMPEAGKQ